MLRKESRGGIFYGWYILAASFFTLFLATGSRNGFGVFIIPMTDDLGWSRGSISAAIAVGWFINGVSQPFIGRVYDRYGGRSVISVSLLILGSSTVLLSQVNNLWSLILIYGFIMSIAGGGASLVTIHAVLAKWFYRKRGMALSIGTAGASAGSMVLAPFATYLILLAGWRTTWAVLGILILALGVPLALLLIRNDPADVGETPDGESGPTAPDGDGRASVTTARRGPLEVENWRDSYRSPPIWQLSGAYFVCGMTTAIISAHYVPFAIDRGASPGTAALAFGLMTGLNVLGVIGVGIVSDRLGRKNLLAGIYAVRGLAYVMLILAPGALGIWGFAVIAGFSWIATAPLTSSLTADIYGLRTMGTLNGMSTFAHQMGGALSILMGGLLYDVFGAYDVPFAIAGVMLIGASLVSLSIRERKYSSRYQPVPSPTPASIPVGDGD